MVPVKAVIHQSEAISDTAKGGIKSWAQRKDTRKHALHSISSLVSSSRNTQIFILDLRPRHCSCYYNLGRMGDAGRWNLNFIIFCHGPTLAVLTGQDTSPGPGSRPWPDLLSLQQFSCSPLPSPSDLHVAYDVLTPCRAITAVLQTVHVYTWPNRITGPGKAVMKEGSNAKNSGPKSCFVGSFTLWLGLPREGGEWSLAVPSCSRCNELRGTVQRFGECNSKHFKVFISAKLCRAAASRCNVTPGRGGG